VLSSWLAYFLGGNLCIWRWRVTTAELHKELVTRRCLLDESRFKLCYALARITPGANSLAFCAGAGLSILEWPGA
jgi:chromate transporter